MRNLFFLVCLPLLLGCATAPPKTFDRLYEIDPKGVWSKQLPLKVQKAVADYQTKKKLRNGLIYGDSVRSVDLRGKTAAELEEELLSKGFEKRDTFWLYARTNQPIQTKQGKRVRMLKFVHEDLGVVRITPDGNPTSRFRKKPDSTKGVAFVGTREFVWEDQAFSVDNSGNAIPKYPKDMFIPVKSKAQVGGFLNNWSERVHTYILTK